MNLEKWWHIDQRDPAPGRVLYVLSEKQGGRATISSVLMQTIRSHYRDLGLIEQDIRYLGLEKAANLLRNRLPQCSRVRSGDIGEILATEFFNSRTIFQIPIKKLRYKDHREMPMRGDDIIGIHKNKDGTLQFLKAEAKSRAVMKSNTLQVARKTLGQNQGRPSPDSLLFIADRLFETGNILLGRTIRNEVAEIDKSKTARTTTHGLYTLSGNSIPHLLYENLKEASNGHKHIVVGACIRDHQQFIQQAYEEVSNLGND